MLKTCLACISLFFTISSHAAESVMTIDELLDKNTEARGGAAAFSNMSTLRIELELTEPAFTVTGHYTATRGGAVRVDIFADGNRVFTEALGPDGGWQMFSDGKIEGLSAEGEAALERGRRGNLYSLQELKSLGVIYRLVGRAKHDNVSYWEIVQVSPGGFSEYLYIDPVTFLIAREVETSALHPDVDSQKERQETMHTVYEASGGLLFSRLSEKRNLDTNALMQSTKVRLVEVNPSIATGHFNRPKTVN